MLFTKHLPIVLSLMGFLASCTNAILYITREEPKSLIRVGLGNGYCANNAQFWRLMVSINNGLPSVDSGRCGYGAGTHIVISQIRWGNTGKCTDADYRDNNGSGWKFCPDANGGGRLENMGVTPWFYRQCFPERANYIISNCAREGICRSSTYVQIWCHDALLDWRNGKREVITEKEALAIRYAAENRTVTEDAKA